MHFDDSTCIWFAKERGTHNSVCSAMLLQKNKKACTCWNKRRRDADGVVCAAIRCEFRVTECATLYASPEFHRNDYQLLHAVSAVLHCTYCIREYLKCDEQITLVKFAALFNALQLSIFCYLLSCRQCSIVKNHFPKLCGTFISFFFQKIIMISGQNQQ